MNYKLYHSIYLFLVIFFPLVSVQGQATIDPICARTIIGLGQDSLIWSATPCPDFDAFVIYSSPDLSSPLSAIDTLFDPGAIGYLQPNPGETPRRYAVAMICNGVQTLISITVSNQRPVTPDIRGVSIVNNVPVLSWYASPSPEVIGYQVYKENPYGSGNFFPYPANNQIINGLSFVDVNSPSLLVRYAIVAVSSCSEGLLGEGKPLDGTTGPHTSIALNTSIDPCTRRITLSWNAYENWAEGVETYDIFLITNGGNPQVVGSTTANNFDYDNAQNGDILEFWVRASESNAPNTVLSNRVLMNVSVNRPMDFLQLTGLTVDAATEGIEIKWRWDMDTDFASAVLQRRSEDSPWADRISFNNQAAQDMSFLDTEVNTNTTRYFYRLISTDNCGGIVQSNEGATILLQGEAQEAFNNFLWWTPLYIEYGTTNYHDFFKSVGGSDSRLASLSPIDSSYEDKVNLRIEAEANSCYYIRAESRLQFPDGHVSFLFSRSNTVCLEQESVLHFPNAIAPEGLNNRFRPIVAYGQNLQSYQLQIYDRYGQLLFATNSLNEAWDGRFKGELLVQGVYSYIAQFTMADGRQEQRKGTIMLVR